MELYHFHLCIETVTIVMYAVKGKLSMHEDKKVYDRDNSTQQARAHTKYNHS